MRIDFKGKSKLISFHQLRFSFSRNFIWKIINHRYKQINVMILKKKKKTPRAPNGIKTSDDKFFRDFKSIAKHKNKNNSIAKT